MSTHALKRRAPGARVRARAFTLVETLLSTTFLALIAGTVAWVMVHCSQVSNLVSASATLQSGARLSMDVFTRDAQDSSRVLGSYTSAGTTYTTSTSGASSALVLETPIYTYDASGSPSATYTDHIIYRLVADAGADGPYTLDRTVVPQSGSPARGPDRRRRRQVRPGGGLDLPGHQDLDGRRHGQGLPPGHPGLRHGLAGGDRERGGSDARRRRRPGPVLRRWHRRTERVPGVRHGAGEQGRD